jgi:metal-responsive CopG/Arc/MetJ family transcriptional regulator
MARVTISLPDELLARLDERARRCGSTRSGLLRELAQRELANGDERRRAALMRAFEHAGSHGGESVRHVREQRREW